MKAKKAKKAGRPALDEAERKTVNFTFRSRAELRDKLSEAAAASGRSISEEIERRLIDSFVLMDINQIVGTAVRIALDEREKAAEAERSRMVPFSHLFKKPDGDEK
ncbi:Arc family DNA-binding protein [Bradyrhizobium sp. McL0616]|uniref:Arc family DNA-binding protein n=1 Tax=Bradyrhizobium sp. McL0616 TaxID=3415674 RepID=UPI003CEBFB28